MGQNVAPGQPLAALLVRVEEQGDPAALDRAIAQARIDVKRASTEHARMQALFDQGAVAERRLTEARFALEEARAGLSSADRRRAQAKRVDNPGEASQTGEVTISSPIGGTVVRVDAIPGATVEEGQPLFRVVDLEELWLEVHVAETHVSMALEPEGVWFEIEGYEGVFEAGPDQVVAVGGLIDESHARCPSGSESTTPADACAQGCSARPTSSRRRRQISWPSRAHP
jgi:multidrug resistance efflux pump